MPEIASVVWEDLGGPQTDLLQIWVQGVEPMARQTIKKPITSQGGLCLSRPIFGLNCKIRQTGALIVGELLLAAALLQCGQFTRLAGCSAGGLHPRSRSRYNPCLLLLVARYNLKAALRPLQLGLGKECQGQAVTNIMNRSPSDASLADHLSPRCQHKVVDVVGDEKK